MQCAYCTVCDVHYKVLDRVLCVCKCIVFVCVESKCHLCCAHIELVQFDGATSSNEKSQKKYQPPFFLFQHLLACVISARSRVCKNVQSSAEVNNDPDIINRVPRFSVLHNLE